MLHSFLTALATVRAAAAAQRVASSAIYTAIVGIAFLVALIFAALAAFFALAPSYGYALAAAIVAAAVGVIAVIILLWASSRMRTVKPTSLTEDLGLPAFSGDTGKQVQAVVERAREEARRIGPVKLAISAFAIGMLMGRR
ncbi:MAG: phage holin family protein [Rhodomicrobiaceae bacterium]